MPNDKNKYHAPKSKKYKKKTGRHTLPIGLKKTVKTQENDGVPTEIMMKSTSNKQVAKKPPAKQITKQPKNKPVKKNAPEKRSFKVIEGYKKKNFIKRVVRYSVLAAIVLALIVTHFALPTGINESLQNLYSSIGSGENPAELQSYNVKSMKVSGSNSYVLSDTYFEIFNKNGKQVLSAQHGFSNPDFKLSSSRAIVFDRGGYGIKVLNDYDVLTEETLEESIYSADISRCGKVAVVTKATGYAAAVTVFSKNFEAVKTYYSNDNLIADVCLNDSGRHAAIAEVYTENGIAKTKISTYSVKTSKIEDSFVLEDTVISSLTNVGGNFIAVSEDGYWFFDWKNCSTQNDAVNGELIYYDIALNGRSVFVVSQNSDYSSNLVYVYGENGKELSNFTIDSVISDVSINKNAISFLSNDTVKVYSAGGELVEEITCGYNTYHIASLGGNNVSAISKSRFYVFK